MVEDIIIVPVAIAYDKLLERRFVRHELMVGVVVLWTYFPSHTCVFSHTTHTHTHTHIHMQGGSKRPETVMQVIRGAWAMLTKNTGSVRVAFAQPFSLQVGGMIPYPYNSVSRNKKVSEGLHVYSCLFNQKLNFLEVVSKLV